VYPCKNQIGYELIQEVIALWAESQKEENVAVKLRLVRMGKRKQPTYRVVAADSRSPRNGRFIEILGTYEPRQEPSVINIDNERALHWLRNGAKPTERVEKLLRITGAWEEFTGKPLEPIVYALKETKDQTPEVDVEKEETSEPVEAKEIINEEEDSEEEASSVEPDSPEVSEEEDSEEEASSVEPDSPEVSEEEDSEEEEENS